MIAMRGRYPHANLAEPAPPHSLSLQYHCLMVAKKSVIIITDNEISLISIFRYYY